MPKYLVEAAYTAEGLRGLQKDKASGRRQAVVKAVEGLEGKVEAFYFAMGKRDVIAIVDLPDAVTAAALSLAVSASGLVRQATTALLDVADIDRALAKKLDWRGPGARTRRAAAAGVTRSASRQAARRRLLPFPVACHQQAAAGTVHARISPLFRALPMSKLPEFFQVLIDG